MDQLQKIESQLDGHEPLGPEDCTYLESLSYENPINRARFVLGLAVRTGDPTLIPLATWQALEKKSPKVLTDLLTDCGTYEFGDPKKAFRGTPKEIIFKYRDLIEERWGQGLQSRRGNLQRLTKLKEEGNTTEAVVMHAQAQVTDAEAVQQAARQAILAVIRDRLQTGCPTWVRTTTS